MPQVQDVVGVFDTSGNELFPNARSVRAMVNERAKVMTHPLETGAQTTDHIVFEPTEIRMSVILEPADYQDTYQQIKNVYLAAATVTVVTKTDTYYDQLLTALPHDETPEMYDTVAIGLKFQEAQFVNAQYSQLPASLVKKKSNASTVKTGQKNPTSAKNSSAAFDLIFGSQH